MSSSLSLRDWSFSLSISYFCSASSSCLLFFNNTISIVFLSRSVFNLSKSAWAFCRSARQRSSSYENTMSTLILNVRTFIHLTFTSRLECTVCTWLTVCVCLGSGICCFIAVIFSCRSFSSSSNSSFSRRDWSNLAYRIYT